MMTSVTVESSPVQVLGVPPTGTYAFIALSNNGAHTAYLKFTPDSTTLTTANGIAIPAGTAMLVDQDVTPVLQNGISAVCASGETTIISVQAY